MEAVAKEMGVTFIDMTTPTLDWLEELGDDASKAYFMISTGKNDNTHLVPCGARKVTEIVCDKIKEQLPEIAKHLVYYHIVIAADGHGDYMTVQEAVNAIPNYSHKEITRVLIKNGVYKEEINIPHTKFRVLFQGEDARSTILTYDKYAKKNWPGRDFPYWHVRQRQRLHPRQLYHFRRHRVREQRRRGEGDRPGRGRVHRRRLPLLQPLPFPRQPGYPVHLRPLWKVRRHQAQLFQGLLH